MLDKLLDAMVNMKEKEAIETARDLIENGEDPRGVLNTCTRAMGTVGERFEKGEYFLPHLIMAGEMLKQISQMVKPRLQGEVVKEKSGRVVIGTVEGDIHDIGKDIVTFILEVNGFEVHDIGIDAKADRFVEEIKQFQPQVVGMSGLLTLAYDSMKNTVDAYVKKLIDVVGKGDGLIVDSGIWFDEAKHENVKAMIEATKKYGVY